MSNTVSAVTRTTAGPSRPRGFALDVQAHRPTEWDGVRAAQDNPLPEPTIEGLFEGILNAHERGDQRGLSLFGHALARIAGGGR